MDSGFQPPGSGSVNYRDADPGSKQHPYVYFFSLIKQEKKAFVAEGGDPHYFEPSKDPLDSKFKEIENIFFDKYEQIKAEQKKELEQNLETKLALIDELKDVNENEENIGKAFNRINAIKKKWDETGAVPNHKNTK